MSRVDQSREPYRCDIVEVDRGEYERHEEQRKLYQESPTPTEPRKLSDTSSKMKDNSLLYQSLIKPPSGPPRPIPSYSANQQSQASQGLAQTYTAEHRSYTLS